MLLVFVPVVSAGLWSDLERVAPEGPELAFACASAPAVSEALEAVTNGLPVTGQEDGVLRGLRALVPGAGRLVGAVRPDAGAVRVDLETALAPEAAARTFAAGRATVTPSAGGAWSVVAPGDGGTWTVRGDAGWLTLAVGAAGAPSDQLRHVPDPLRSAVPEPESGCLIWGHRPVGPAGDVQAAVTVPLVKGAPLRFGATLPTRDLLSALRFAPGPPREVRTTTAPDAVAVLGLGLDGIDFGRFLQGAARSRARRLQHLLPVTAGTEVAFVRAEAGTPRFVAMLPLGKPLRAAAVSRRAEKVLRALGYATSRNDRTRLVAVRRKDALFVDASDGRLYVSNTLPALTDAVAARGDVWVDGDTATRAARWPFVAEMAHLPGPAGAVPLAEPLTLSLTVAEGVVAGELIVPMSAHELGLALLLLAGQAGDPGPATAPPSTTAPN